MAKHVFANLAPIGWIELPDDAVISREFSDPSTWAREGGILDSVALSNIPGRLDEWPFVHISYQGKDYRVSPLHLQIVEY